MNRGTFEDMLAPYGPLVVLGIGDPTTIRQILRKCGIDRVVVTPDGPGAWRFEGQADFSGEPRIGGSERRGIAVALLDFPTAMGASKDPPSRRPARPRAVRAPG